MSMAPDGVAPASTGGSGGPRSGGPLSLVGVAIALALAAGVALRFVSVSDLWLDEALTVHVAQVPWGDLEPALRRDGAPPLFYALLHVWIDLFGSSDTSVRALGGFVSVAMLPLAWFAGRRVGGVRLAWITVVVLAASPYAIRYATEVRMYALESLLVLAGFLLLVRALERPSLGRLAPVALVTAALLYNQYWSPYLVAVVGAGLAAAAWKAEAPLRAAAGRVLVAVVVGGLAFVPWLPTLRYQVAHTGTPWGEVYLPPAGFGLTAIDFAGARFAFGWILALFVVALPLLGLFGRAVDRRRVELDLRTVAPVRWIAGAALGTMVLGLTMSYLSANTYEGRYGAVVFPLFVLVAARGLTVFADERVQVALVALVVVLGLGVGAQHAAERRTQAGDAAEAILAGAQDGDVVVFCPDQLGPAVARLLGDAELDMLTFPDGDDPTFVNWVDYADRYAASDPEGFAAEVVDRSQDRSVWLVASSGYQHTDGPCGALELALTQVRPDVDRVLLEDTNLLEHHSVSRFAP